jgi:DNA-binding protein YbaB
MAFDQVKMINQLRKAQNDLKKEIIEVEAGEGAVVIQVTG